ncbi:helix-turn-helix transcriptional regulator [Mucilaginibacter terrae]|uniref:AraC-like DNA-binding protein n=1 Tax=Mucilaginibacter terrae TaxID=1955052 RepID=A0ABU3H0R9_9SPHI|nr:AraC family transcriptional regulator [Mucilaginibacter terrae]MDT3404842.1 AraC-like DNA-binding protein [Mucilaginibacter terrae]
MEVEQNGVPNVLIRFAGLLNTTVSGHRLDIPQEFGSGYCAGFVFNDHLRMLISDYELNHDLLIENTEKRPGKILFFKFQKIFPKNAAGLNRTRASQTPSVLIATSRLNTEDAFTIHSNTETINIEVDTAYLAGLFKYTTPSPVLQKLLGDAPPLLFEQLLHPAIQNIVDEIVTEKVQNSFRLFFLRIKAEELICRLLIELDKRSEKQFYPLNNRDIQAIYKIRDAMIMKLSEPPLIAILSAEAGMSPTKLKRLFKQIFGYSVFSYYQHFRMKEAARLLRQEQLSVSETGYRLGFTNLSHFTRIFEEHVGMKPKAYSRA